MTQPSDPAAEIPPAGGAAPGIGAPVLTAPPAEAPATRPVGDGRRPRALRVVTRPGHPFSTGVLVTAGALLTIAIGLAVLTVSTVLLSILLALFLALGLDPLVRWLERHRVSRGRAIAAVFAAFAVVVGLVMWLVVPRAIAQVIELAQAIPEAMQTIAQTEWFRTATASLGADADASAQLVVDRLADPERLLALSGGLLSAVTGVAGAISSTFVVVVLTLYFLASLAATKETFYRLTRVEVRPTVRRLTETITDSMGGFVMTMIVLGACNAGVVYLLHLLIGLPYPALMALVAFLLTLIPVIGSVVFWAVGTVVALFTDPTAAIAFAVAYLVYMQIESYVLTPRLMGRTIAVPGVLVLVGALLGGALLGLLGALVAVPITAAITLIVREVAIPRQDLPASDL